MIMSLLFPVSILTTVISYPYHHNPHFYNDGFPQGHDFGMRPPGPWYPVHHPLHNHEPGHPWHRPTHHFPDGHPQKEWFMPHGKEETPTIDTSEESSEENEYPLDNIPFKETITTSTDKPMNEIKPIPTEHTNQVMKQSDISKPDQQLTPVEIPPVEISHLKPSFDIFTQTEATTKQNDKLDITTSKSVELNNNNRDVIEPMTEFQSIDVRNERNTELPQLFLSKEHNEDDAPFVSKQTNDDDPDYVSKLVDPNNLNKYLNLNGGKTEQMFTSQPSENSFLLFDQTKSKDVIYNLPDLIIKNNVIEVKSSNSQIKITSPAIVINDDDKTIQGNVLTPQMNNNNRLSSVKPQTTNISPVFGGTNLDERRNPTNFHEDTYKDLLNAPSLIETSTMGPDLTLHDGPILKKEADIISEINEGKFSGVFGPFTPEEIKNMQGFNEQDLALIQKEINDAIKKGYVDFFKGQLETTTESAPLDSDLRSGRIL